MRKKRTAASRTPRTCLAGTRRFLIGLLERCKKGKLLSSVQVVRIGLMRHFPVMEPLPRGWRTARELHEWCERYDASDPVPRAIDLGTAVWQKCLSSNMRRAYATAQAAYTAEIIQTHLLREAEFAPFRTGRLRLPVRMWHWVLRGAWLTSHPSQRKMRDDFRRRVRTVADMLDAEQHDTLVVSHAGMMLYLRKELVRRGFQGPEFGVAEHARLYVFERGT
jgi:broad specificity phosphatase PhoE